MQFADLPLAQLNSAAQTGRYVLVRGDVRVVENPFTNRVHGSAEDLGPKSHVLEFPPGSEFVSETERVLDGPELIGSQCVRGCLSGPVLFTVENDGDEVLAAARFADRGTFEVSADGEKFEDIGISYTQRAWNSFVIVVNPDQREWRVYLQGASGEEALTPWKNLHVERSGVAKLRTRNDSRDA